MQQILELFNNYEQILNRSFSAKDIRVPYRNINHWDENGLLLNPKRADGQWRKFNFMDCMWIRIISELRKFGVAFPLIKLLKEIATEKVPFQTAQDTEDNIDYYNILMLLLVEVIITRSPISILLNTQGESFFYNPRQQNQYGDDYLDFTKTPHINISLPYLLAQFIIENDISLFDEKLPIITKDEFEVIQKIRNLTIRELSLHAADRESKFVLKSETDGADGESSQLKFITSIFSNDYDIVCYQTIDGKSVEFKTQQIYCSDTTPATQRA